MSTVRSQLSILAEEEGFEIAFHEGLDDALVGVAEVPTADGIRRAALYDRRKCLDILVGEQGWSTPEAAEWLEVVGSHLDALSPVFATFALPPAAILPQ